ncbi:MAG: hypothetical protein LBS54_08530 [Dysgonamonadaceae bacterium]|jgi:hypothetical protein|nr:hypothetical protein [Dysgonamonadaceae bacterium]
MYQAGNIIYFTPFHFKKGEPKNKYFLVLATTESSLIVASLPTSQDHIPSGIRKEHGCINDTEKCVNCYFFEKHKIISECGTFGFPRDTYIYGEQVDVFSKEKMIKQYRIEKEDYIIVCKLSDTEFQSIKNCLKLSGNLKRKVKKYL